MERHWEQGSANEADGRQVWGEHQAGDEHRNTRGKQNRRNTGELIVKKMTRHKKA